MTYIWGLRSKVRAGVWDFWVIHKGLIKLNRITLNEWIQNFKALLAIKKGKQVPEWKGGESSWRREHQGRDWPSSWRSVSIRMLADTSWEGEFSNTNWIGTFNLHLFAENETKGKQTHMDCPSFGVAWAFILELSSQTDHLFNRVSVPNPHWFQTGESLLTEPLRTVSEHYHSIWAWGAEAGCWQS